MGKNVDPQTVTTSSSRANPPLDHIRSMPQNHITETLIAALPHLSNVLISEAQRTAKALDLNDARFIECILDLELLGGFDKALEFVHDKGLASAYIDAIIFNLTTGDPGAIPNEVEFREGGTERYRGIAKYAVAKDYFSVSFPEAWLFGKEYSQIKTGNAMDFAYVASVGSVVVTILKIGALIFQQALRRQ